MAADNAFIRQNYVTDLQTVAALALQLQEQLVALSAVYQGAALAGTFVDAELAANNASKHLVSADITTYTANLNTINTAITTNIQQNLAKAVGRKTTRS